MGAQEDIWTLTGARLKPFMRRAERERSAALTALLMMPFRLAGRLAWAGYGGARRYLRRRANRRILARLSDTQLKDIGVARSEIPYAVWSLEFERNRARLRARNRPGEDGTCAVARAPEERPAEDACFISATTFGLRSAFGVFIPRPRLVDERRPWHRGSFSPPADRGQAGGADVGTICAWRGLRENTGSMEACTR